MEKSVCPTCNRRISKLSKFGLTEFYRKIRNITDIHTLNTTKDYILRVIRYYYPQNIYNDFVNEFNSRISMIEQQEPQTYNDCIKSIKEWILSFHSDTPISTDIRQLEQLRKNDLVGQLREYLKVEYLNNNKDLIVPFSQFYDDFSHYNKQQGQICTHSKQAVSRALSALGVKAKAKKLNEKIQVCLSYTNEQLNSANI